MVRVLGGVEVVRKVGQNPSGLEITSRITILERNGIMFSRFSLEGGGTGAWHHHGTRELYGFVLTGRLRLESGPEGKETFDLGAGDFFHIPPGLVHRDVNLSRLKKVVVLSAYVGTGTVVVNVDRPPLRSVPGPSQRRRDPE